MLTEEFVELDDMVDLAVEKMWIITEGLNAMIRIVKNITNFIQGDLMEARNLLNKLSQIITKNKYKRYNVFL